MDDNKKAKEQVQDAPNKGPVWTYFSNRVSVSIFRHQQESGTVRHTIAICRSYFVREENHWKRTHFFDEQDLPDVEKCRLEAVKYLNSVWNPKAE